MMLFFIADLEDDIKIGSQSSETEVLPFQNPLFSLSPVNNFMVLSRLRPSVRSY